MEEELINQVVIRNIVTLKKAKKPEAAQEAVQCLKWIVTSPSLPIIARTRAENALNAFDRKFSKEA